MRNRSGARLIVLTLALAVPARFAGAAPDKPGEADNPYVKRFKELDRNKDGYVTLDEWPLDPPRFHRVDRNKDGRLSRHELLTPNVLREGTRPLNPKNVWSPRATPQDQNRFRGLDRNHDNRLSRIEWTVLKSRFNYLDLDQDGLISPREWRR